MSSPPPRARSPLLERSRASRRESALADASLRDETQSYSHWLGALDDDDIEDLCCNVFTAVELIADGLD